MTSDEMNEMRARGLLPLKGQMAVDHYLERLEDNWNDNYYSEKIPQHVKENRNFMDGYNQLKLKNGPLADYTPDYFSWIEDLNDLHSSDE